MYFTALGHKSLHCDKRIASHFTSSIYLDISLKWCTLCCVMHHAKNTSSGISQTICIITEKTKLFQTVEQFAGDGITENSPPQYLLKAKRPKHLPFSGTPDYFNICHFILLTFYIIFILHTNKQLKYWKYNFNHSTQYLRTYMKKN